jgi:uncharacterized protein (TIGR02246 family)
MKRSLAVVLLILAHQDAHLGMAQQTAAPARSLGPPDQIALLMKMEEARVQAGVRKDIEAVAAASADEYLQIDFNGDVRDKAAAMERIKAPSAFQLKSNTLDDMVVRIYGDTAVVTARSTPTGTLDGRDFSQPVRYSRVYVKRDGRWQVVTFQMTRVAETSRPPAAAAETKPEALVDGFVRAWNSHDMKAFGALFAEDADFVNVAGRRWKGRGEIQARHEESHAKGFAASVLKPTGVTVRRLGGETAVVHFNWELAGQRDADGKELPLRRGTMLMVARQQAGAWSIVAAQNTNEGPSR